MRIILMSLVCALLWIQPAGAKPGTENDERYRSPGKPEHPLQLDMVVDKSALRAGVEIEGRLVVRSSVPVEQLAIMLRPSAGVNVLSNGVLDRHVGRLRPGEPVEMPLRITPASDDSRRMVVLLRAVQPDGRVMTREVKVNLGETPQRRDKLRRRNNAPAPEGKPGEAVVEAEQEIIRN